MSKILPIFINEITEKFTTFKVIFNSTLFELFCRNNYFKNIFLLFVHTLYRFLFHLISDNTQSDGQTDTLGYYITYIFSCVYIISTLFIHRNEIIAVFDIISKENLIFVCLFVLKNLFKTKIHFTKTSHRIPSFSW